MAKVFVYDSLKREQPHHELLAASRFIGKARTEPVFDMLDLGDAPAVVAGEHAIDGEVFEVSDRTLLLLDIFEHNGVRHNRQEVEVTVNGRKLAAWMYVFIRNDGSYDSVEPTGNHQKW